MNKAEWEDFASQDSKAIREEALAKSEAARLAASDLLLLMCRLEFAFNTKGTESGENDVLVQKNKKQKPNAEAEEKAQGRMRASRQRRNSKGFG